VRLRTGASPALEWVFPVTKGVDPGQLRSTSVYCSASRTTTWRAGDQARSRHGRTGAEADQPVHVFNIAQVREQGAEPPDVDRRRPELGDRRAEPDENAYRIGRSVQESARAVGRALPRSARTIPPAWARPSQPRAVRSFRGLAVLLRTLRGAAPACRVDRVLPGRSPGHHVLGPPVSGSGGRRSVVRGHALRPVRTRRRTRRAFGCRGCSRAGAPRSGRPVTTALIRDGEGRAR
jgi:hypothetical protein